MRRLGPSDAQPLPLVLSVPSERPPGLHATLVGVVVLAGLLAVLTAWRLARVTTRPLAELAGAVDRVAQGDLTARVPVRSRDEVGRLAAAFNRMTRETGSYVAALTSNRDQLRGHLAVLGDTLASTHDLQRILRVILRSAIGATGARAGAVLLVETGGVLVAQCTEGLDGRWPAEDADGSQTLRVPVGVGVVGAVAATGEPQRGRAEPTEAPTGEPRCRTYVAVPFAAPAGGAAATLGADPRGRPTRRARRPRSACWPSTTGWAPTSSTTTTWPPCAPSPATRRWRWTTSGCTRRRSGSPSPTRSPGCGTTATCASRSGGRWNGPAGSGGCSASSRWTWTGSRTSTTRTGTLRGTPCWPSSPGGCAGRSARSTWPSGRAVRSSCCCCRRPTRGARRSWPSGSARRCATRPSPSRRTPGRSW